MHIKSIPLKYTNNNTGTHHHYYFDPQAQQYFAFLIGLPVAGTVSVTTLVGIHQFLRYTNEEENMFTNYFNSQNNPSNVQTHTTTTINQSGINVNRTTVVDPNRTPPRRPGVGNSDDSCNPVSPARNSCGCNID